MFRSRQVSVRPPDQLAPVREALLKAIAAADDRERPGLQTALRIVGEYSPEELRRRWAAGVIATAGLDPVKDKVRAVKAIRDALPGLPLKDAVDLVKEIAALRDGEYPAVTD